MDDNRLLLEKINQMIRAAEKLIESLVVDLEKLDEFKDADAYRAVEAHIRDLKDQRRMLNKQWLDLTAGFLDKS